MAGHPNRIERALIRSLAARLDAAATARSRCFWESYLKHAVAFRGVPMGEIRKAVHAWWKEEQLAQLPSADQKRLALALFEGDFGEDKLAGTLVLQELLLTHLGRGDLAAFGELFERGLIADWSTCDWFCVKVLGRMLSRDLPTRAMADELASWREAKGLWRRRASNVAFVDLARRGDGNFVGFTALMLETCAVTVRSPERFAQTGVGWLLRELAETERAAVLDFARAHAREMSREGVRYVVERMPAPVKQRVLREHATAAKR